MDVKLFKWNIGISALLLILGISSCSEMSVFTLLENEQTGELKVNQREVMLQTDHTVRLDAQGGFLPYSFEVIDDTNLAVGTLDSITGLYKAPRSSELGDTSIIVEVAVTDRLENRDSVEILVFHPLTLSQSIFTLIQGAEEQHIEIEGGLPPFEYGWEGEEKQAVSDQDFDFDTSPLPPGEYFLEVTDAMDNSAFVRVRVNQPGTLLITPAQSTVSFDASTPLVFDVDGGSTISEPDPLLLSEPEAGSLTWDSGQKEITFTPAPPLAKDSSFYITIEDDIGNTARTDIIVQEDEEIAALEISPAAITVSSGAEAQFTASGGVTPYIFSAIPGKNAVRQVSATTVAVTVQGPPWNAHLRVDDKLGNRAEASITIEE